MIDWVIEILLLLLVIISLISLIFWLISCGFVLPLKIA